GTLSKRNEGFLYCWLDENYGAIRNRASLVAGKLVMNLFVWAICPIILDNGKRMLSIIFDTLVSSN
ncbi:MAG: hypothetical protein K2N82_03945, partial [Lachnospiraceae bacterium]|nr:hypothetical protein [Lachnospiraceae bacterium]